MLDLPGTQIVNPGGGAAPDGPETGWRDVWDTTIRSMREVDNANARSIATERSIDDIIKGLDDAGIKHDLVNPFRVRRDSRAAGITPDDPNYAPYSPLIEDRVGWFERRRRELADENPERRALFRADTPIEEIARERAREAEEQAQQALARYQGALPSWTASIPGGFAGSMYDPINVATLAAGPWARVGRGAMAVVRNGLLTGAVNGAAELAIQPYVQEWRREAGLEHGLGMAASNVAMAAALGFGLDAIIRGTWRGIAGYSGLVPRLDERGLVEGWMRPRAEAEIVSRHGVDFEPKVEDGVVAYYRQRTAPKPAPGVKPAGEAPAAGARLPEQPEAPPAKPRAETEPTGARLPGKEQGTPSGRTHAEQQRLDEEAEAFGAALEEVTQYDTAHNLNLRGAELTALAQRIMNTGEEVNEAFAAYSRMSKTAKKAFIRGIKEVPKAAPEEEALPEPRTETDRILARAREAAIGKPEAEAISIMEAARREIEARAPKTPEEAEAAMAAVAAARPKGDPVRDAMDGDPKAYDQITAGTEFASRPSNRAARQTADADDKVSSGQPSEFMAEADHVQAVRDFLGNATDPENRPMPVAPEPSVPRRLIDKDTPVGENIADRPSPRQGYELFGKPVVSRLVRLAEVVRDPETFPRLNKRNILAGVQRWNSLMADKGFYVFERLDGTLVVAEGHDRLVLAQGLMHDGREADLDIAAEVFREADGWSVADVRAQAAHKNIAEERVTDPLQIATILRDRPELMTDPTIAPTRHYMEQAKALARLSDEAWQLRAREGIDANYAAEVGKYVHRVDEHAEAMELVASALRGEIGEVTPTNVEQIRSIVQDYVGRRAGGEVFLPGDPAITLYTERALVLDRAVRGLRLDANVFGMLVREYGRIAGIGRNVLDTASNLKRKAQSKLARDIIAALAHQDGNLRDWLSDAASSMMVEDPVTGILRMPAGKKARNQAADAAAREFTEKLRTALSTPEGFASLRPRAPQPLEGSGAGVDVPGGPRAKAQADRLQADLVAQMKRLERDNAQGHLAEWLDAFHRDHVGGLDGSPNLTPREKIEVAELMLTEQLDIPSAINEVRARRRAAADEQARLEDEARLEAKKKADAAAAEAKKKAEAEAAAKEKAKEGGKKAEPKKAEPEEEVIDEPDIARLAKGREWTIPAGFKIDELGFIDTGVERAGWKVYVQPVHPVSGEWAKEVQPHLLVKGDRGVAFSNYMREEGNARGLDFVENFLRKEEEALRAGKSDKYRQMIAEEAGVERLLTQWNLVNVAKRLRGGTVPPEYAAMEKALEKLGVAQRKNRKEVKALLEKAEAEGSQAFADAEVESRKLGGAAQPEAAGAAGEAAQRAGRRTAEAGGPEAPGAGGEGAAGGDGRTERDAALDKDRRQSINPSNIEGKGLLDDAVRDAKPGDFVAFDEHVPGFDIAMNREIEPLMDLARELGFTEAGGGHGKIGIVQGVKILGFDADLDDVLVDVHFIEKDSGGATFVWTGVPWRSVLGSAGQTHTGLNHIGLFAFGGHHAAEDAALGLPAAGEFFGGGFRDPLGRHPLRVVGEDIVSDLGGNPWLRASRSFGDWLRGTLMHEFGHSIWASLDAATQRLLIDHANLLRVMEWRYSVFRSATHFEPMQMKSWEVAAAGKSLRRMYEDYYRWSNPNASVAFIEQLLNEEAVMHMLQLAYLGHIPKEMLEPIRHVLEKHFDGPSKHISRALDAEPSLRAGGVREVVVRAPTVAEAARARRLALFRQLRAEGLSNAEIADALGVSETTLANFVRDNPDIPRRMSRWQGHADDAELARMFNAGASTGEMAQAIGISKDKVRKRLARMGLYSSRRDLRSSLDHLAPEERTRILDSLNMYSRAQEAAINLPDNWKGTPSNVLSHFKRGGVKDAEVEVTGLKEFLKGKKSVTKQDLVQHLTDRRFVMEETVYGALVKQINHDSKYALPEVVRAAERAGDHEGDLGLTLANDGDAYHALMRRFPELRDNEDWAEVVANDVFGGGTKPAGTVKYGGPDTSLVPGDETAYEIVPNVPRGALTARARELTAELERLERERAALSMEVATSRKQARQVAENDVKFETVLDDGEPTTRATANSAHVGQYSPQGDGRMLVELPGRNAFVARDEAAAEEMIRQHAALSSIRDTPLNQRLREVANRSQEIRFELDREGWTDPHYSDAPNVIGQARGFLAKTDDGKTVDVMQEIQPQRAQRIRDDWRDMVAARMFAKNEAAKEALERQRDEALARFEAIPFEQRMKAPGSYDPLTQVPFGYSRPLTPEANALQAEVNRLSDEIIKAGQPVTFKNLAPDQKKQVSAAIEAARQRGELPASVRDERRVAELSSKLETAVAEREAIAKEVNAEFDAIGLAPLQGGEYSAFYQAEQRAQAFQRLLRAAQRDGNSAVIGTLLGHAETVDRALDRLINSSAIDLEEQLSEAMRVTPGHPLVNTTDASLRYLIRRHIQHAVRTNADHIGLVPAQVQIERGWGTVEGMRQSYDNIYIRTYLEELNEILRDSYAFQDFNKPWLDLNDKQKAQVRSRMDEAGAEVTMADLPLKQQSGREIMHDSQDWDAMFRQEFDAEYGELARDKYWEEVWSEDGTGVAAQPRHKVDAGDGIKVFDNLDEAEAYMVDVATRRAREKINEIKAASGTPGGPVQFHTFTLPPRIKAQVRRGGLRLMSIDPMGAEQARELDKLGFYSHALEAAKGLKQAKGTPEQMLAQLKKAGVKDAEIAATGLDAFLKDKKSVSRDDIVKHLTENRVEVREVRYGGDRSDWAMNIDVHLDDLAARGVVSEEVLAELDGIGGLVRSGEVSIEELRTNLELSAEARAIVDDFARKAEAAGVAERAGPTKWASLSLDPSNPTYRETVLHLPPKPVSVDDPGLKAFMRARGVDWDTADPQTIFRLSDEYTAAHRPDFRQGHFSEPNVIAHARTSLQKDSAGNTVFLIDELQSDWGQKLREGGVRDEAKIAELEKNLAKAKDDGENAISEAQHWLQGNTGRRYIRSDYYAGLTEAYGAAPGTKDFRGNSMIEEAFKRMSAINNAMEHERLLDAELRTARAATPGHPMVNTTDQWTTTAFKRLVAQAVAAGADRIAITPGRVQADRFSLRRVVERVKVWLPKNKPGYRLAILHTNNGSPALEVDPNGIVTDARDGLDAAKGRPLSEIIGERGARAVMAVDGDGTSLALDDIEVGGEGMRATYDGIYPKNLGKVLKGLDPEIKGAEDIDLRSSVDGRTFAHENERAGDADFYLREANGDYNRALIQARRDRAALRNGPDTARTEADIAELDATIEALKAEKAGNGPRFHPILFHSFPLTDRVKARVRREGMRMFAIDPMGARPRERDGLGLYSHLKEVARNVKQAKGPAADMFGLIVGAPGVREAEVVATNLDKFLLGDELAMDWRALNRMRNELVVERKDIADNLPPLKREAGETDKAWAERRKAREKEISETERVKELQQPYDEAEKAFKAALKRAAQKQPGQNAPVHFVSRDEILAHLEANQTRLAETQYGGEVKRNPEQQAAYEKERQEIEAGIEEKRKEVEAKDKEVEARRQEVEDEGGVVDMEERRKELKRRRREIEEEEENSLRVEAYEDAWEHINVSDNDIASSLDGGEWSGARIDVSGGGAANVLERLGQAVLPLIGGEAKPKKAGARLWFKYDHGGYRVDGYEGHLEVEIRTVVKDDTRRHSRTKGATVIDLGDIAEVDARGEISARYASVDELDKDIADDLLKLVDGDKLRAQAVLDEINESLPTKIADDHPRFEEVRDELEREAENEYVDDYVRNNLDNRVDARMEELENELESQGDDILSNLQDELSGLERQLERLEGRLDALDRPNQPKFANWSLDPQNKSSTEYVISLQDTQALADARARLKELNHTLTEGPGPLSGTELAERHRLEAIIKAWEDGAAGYYEGHFSDVKGYVFHIRTAVQVDKDGKRVLQVVEIQATGAQKLRDAGGARDEAQIVRLKNRTAAAERQRTKVGAEAVEKVIDEARKIREANVAAGGERWVALQKQAHDLDVQMTKHVDDARALRDEMAEKYRAYAPSYGGRAPDEIRQTLEVLRGRDQVPASEHPRIDALLKGIEDTQKAQVEVERARAEDFKIDMSHRLDRDIYEDKGYNTDNVANGILDTLNRIVDAPEALYGQEITKAAYRAVKRLQAAMQEVDLRRSELANAEQAKVGHPMINTTDQWVRTASGIILNKAVELNVDRIAFDPGRVQKDRYSAATVARSLRYDPATGHLQYIPVGRTEWASVHGDGRGPYFKREELPEVIGREMSERLLAEPPSGGRERSPSGAEIAPQGYHVLSDLESLELGNEEFRTPYEVIYPRAMWERLREFDKDAKRAGRDTLFSTYDQRELTHKRGNQEPIQFPIIDISEKVKEGVRREGVKMYSIDPMGARPRRPTKSPEEKKADAEAMGFDTSKVWYHGSSRIDRVVEKGKLDPKRATSGPMPFFTDDPEMASGYATGKKTDTSLQAEDDYSGVASYFRVDAKNFDKRARSKITVEQSWHWLTPEQRATIAERAKRVGYEDLDTNEGSIVLHPKGVDAALSSSHYDWVLKNEARGNHLAALREMWHDSGSLVGNEYELAEIYRLAGYPYPIDQSKAPWVEASGVIPVYLKMRNPLRTDDFENLAKVVDELEKLLKRDRTRKTEHSDSDPWDKRHRWTPKEWVAQLKEDMRAGGRGSDASYVFTSIPDKVTAALRQLGYDGILDVGGKGGGKQHEVAIPFSPQQVRSVNAEFNPAKADSPLLLASHDPMGGDPSKRKKLSIPGLKAPPAPKPVAAPATPAGTVSGVVRQILPTDRRGVFPTAPHLEWTGLPPAEYTANLTHIAEKRELKETERRFVELLNTPEKVDAHIRRVLEKPSFAYIKWNRGAPEALNVLRWNKDHYELVGISLAKSDRGRLYIATAFNQSNTAAASRVSTALYQNGMDVLRWNAADPAVQRELSRLFGQVPADRQGPHVDKAKALVRKGQAPKGTEEGAIGVPGFEGWAPNWKRIPNPDDDGGFRASLEGVAAARRRPDGQVALEAAQTMERAGRTETEIAEATGFFRLPNGKWAREFSDESVKLRPEAAEALKVTGQKVGRGYTARMPAASAFSAPEVWRRYPELAHLTVELSGQRTIADVQAMRQSGFGSGRGPMGGQTPSRPAYSDLDKGNIRIVASSPEEAASKFANELYRYIARIEGFPEGGTPASAMAAVRQIRRSVDAEATAITERLEQLNPSTDWPVFQEMFDQLMQVRAVGARLDDMYPEAAYGALLGTQVGATIGRRQAMTAAERQGKPFMEDLAGATPREGSIVTREGPQRQFSADGQGPPDLWPDRDTFAGLSPAVQQLTGLHGLPLTVRLSHILESRGKKTAKGKYGPNGDLHTLEQVRAHIEKVTSDPDFSWVSANRDGTFSMNLAKIEDGFVRVVPVSLSPPRDGRGLIPTIFNEFPKDAAWRITSAWNQEGERGLKWKQTLDGHQLVLHLLEQASDDKRTSAWIKLRGEIYRRQARLKPRPAPRLVEQARRIDRQATLNPVQEQEFAGMIGSGASVGERLETFRQMVGRDVSASTMWNHIRDMERRGLVTLKERLPETLSRITPEQEGAYAAVYSGGGLSPDKRLAVFRKIVGDEKASRSSMYKFERSLAQRNLITPPEARPARKGMTAGLTPDQRRDYASYYPTETSAERRLERFRQLTGKPTASAGSLQAFERELAAEGLITMRGRGRPSKTAEPADPASEMMNGAERAAQISEITKSCKS